MKAPQASRLATLSLTTLALALTGCASLPVPHEDVASASRLQPAKSREEPFEYRSGDADFGSYTKILIAPVAIYDGQDAQFGSISEQDREKLAEYMGQQFAKTLGGGYQIVTAPGPDTLRLRLTLTGIRTSRPVIATLSHLVPAGLVINAGLAATDHHGTFFGAVSYSAEISDSSTGKVLYAYVSQETPNALDLPAAFGKLAAARDGVRIGATHLLHQLTQGSDTIISDAAADSLATP